MARLTVANLQKQASELGLVLIVEDQKVNKYSLERNSNNSRQSFGRQFSLLKEVAEEMKYYESNGCFTTESFKPAYDSQSFEEVERNNYQFEKKEAIAFDTTYTAEQISQPNKTTINNNKDGYLSVGLTTTATNEADEILSVEIEHSTEVKEGKQLSPYQEAIINWAINEEGNGCVNAVAGSGKSTTLKLVAKALQNAGMSPSNIRIIVFGKANANDLIAKFGQEWKGSISTLHSAGLQILRDELRKKPDISESKYKWIAQDLGYMSQYDKRSKQWITGALTEDELIKNEADFIKLLNLTRLTNQEPDQEVIDQLASHFEIEDIFNSRAVANAIADCLAEGESRARQRFLIDYTDMIYLPVKWQLKVKPFKLVLIDECQDLNKAQLELSLMLAGKFGRILSVGDRKQAIMGFSGADCNSFQNIVDRTKAKELPLSICYRCPKSHVKLVNQIFPNIPIEAAPNALIGSIQQINELELDKQLTVGDLVLSRKTAPLVKICIQLITKGIPATVKGKDIGASLKKEIEEIAKIKGFEYQRFTDFVSLYKDAKIERLEKLDNAESMIQNLNDKLTAIETIYVSHIEAKNVKQLCEYIDSLFSDEESPITLSTAHRAKGLENDRIFLIKPNDMPMTWRGQSNWQYEQEENLLYVALTRSKNELFIVGDAHWFVEEDKTTEDNTETTEVKPVEVKLESAPIVVYQRPRLHNTTEAIANGIIITPYVEPQKQDSSIQETGLVSLNGYPIIIEGDRAIIKNPHGVVVQTYDLTTFNLLKHRLKTKEQYQKEQAELEQLKQLKVNKTEKIKTERTFKERPPKKAKNTGKIPEYNLPPANEIKPIKPGSVMDKIVELLRKGSTIEEFEAVGIGTGRNGLSHFAPYINKQKGIGVRTINGVYHIWE